MAVTLSWKSITHQGEVVYWQGMLNGRLVGAAAFRGGAWKAIGYPRDSRPPGPLNNADLGRHDSREAAQDAVAQYITVPQTGDTQRS